MTTLFANLHRRITAPDVHNRPRILILGLLSALAVIGLYAVNAAATAPSAADLQIRGWVDALESDRLTAARQQAQRNLELAGDAAVPQLLAALRSDNPTMRLNAADILGYVASPRATDGLLQVVRTDAVPQVRRNAAWALGEIKDSSAVNDLARISVTDTSQMVRATAADSLARIKTALALSASVNDQTVGGFAVAPSQPNLVFLAAKRDLFTSLDGGKTWTQAASALPTQVTALAVHPARTTELFAGTEGLGMYKSTDGGKTWTAINDGIELTPGARTTVTDIAIDPENPQIIYIARGLWLGTGRVEFHPLGLMSSTDGGRTWSTLHVGSSTEGIQKLAFRAGQLYGLAGDRVLTLVTPR
jgi:hypothetical protein